MDGMKTRDPSKILLISLTKVKWKTLSDFFSLLFSRVCSLQNMDGMKPWSLQDALISINKSERLSDFSLSLFSRVMFFAEHGWYENQWSLQVLSSFQ
jgi:hypothetical protein